MEKDVQLTAREEEVMRALVSGYSNKEISKHLYMSVGTVKSHLESIYPKLNIHNRVQAVVWALKNLDFDENI